MGYFRNMLHFVVDQRIIDAEAAVGNQTEFFYGQDDLS
jgi:hypothetical protein